MLPAARIEAAIELLAAIIETPRPADATISVYFRDRRFIGSKDRAAINLRIYRLIRSYHRLCWWIKKSACDVRAREDLRARARAIVIADLLFTREQSPTSIGEIFSGEKFYPAPLSDEEMKLVQDLDKKELESAEMPLREKMECPEWAFEMMQKSLGPGFEAEMKAMLTPAPMDLRVNLIKATRDDVLAELKKDGVDAHEGKLSPLSIRVFGRPQLSQHPLYLSGAFEVQDEGSQMIAAVADAKPGEQVVDYCAGAGGKTLARGASMNNKGRIIAMDVLERRLEKAKLRFRRAGLHNIETHALGVAGDKWLKRHRDYFDLVLVDAPCTGSGTWRREPDKRWRTLGPGLEELLPLQREILESAHRLVKSGGRLVYATCSLLREENQEQVEAFVKDHSAFEMVGEPLVLTPARNDTDGFFAAVLKRKA